MMSRKKLIIIYGILLLIDAVCLIAMPTVLTFISTVLVSFLLVDKIRN